MYYACWRRGYVAGITGGGVGVYAAYDADVNVADAALYVAVYDATAHAYAHALYADVCVGDDAYIHTPALTLLLAVLLTPWMILSIWPVLLRGSCFGYDVVGGADDVGMMLSRE